MALLSFCNKGKKNVRALYLHHRTTFSDVALSSVREYCDKEDVELLVRFLPKETSPSENWWRAERRKIYETFPVVATGHTLDDAIEWWVMSSLRGQPRLMYPTSNGLIKPFLLTDKTKLVDWCMRKCVPFLVDPTNMGDDNERAILRSRVMSGLTQMHPGFRTTIRKKLLQEIRDRSTE